MADPEYPLLITLGALLIASPLIKTICDRSRIPPLVGYIALGFLLRLVDAEWSFVTPAFENTVSLLAQLGVFALLFRVGLKSHTDALLAKLPDAALIWVGDVLTNVVVGFLVSRYLLSLPLGTSLVIATAFSATSVAVSVAAWDDLHRLNTSRGQLLLDVAELDDLSGVLLLAIIVVVIPILGGGDGRLWQQVAWTTSTVVVKLALFTGGCYLFAHYVEARFTHLARRLGSSLTALTIAVLGAGLMVAAIAGYLGFSLAIGALFAGLAFSRDPDAVRTEGRFSNFYEFLTPFFFIQIGMQVHPGAVVGSLGLGAVLFVFAVLGKFVGVAGTAWLSMRGRDAAVLGVSMIPRAEIALVVVYQCSLLEHSIVSREVFSAMVLVSVVTSVASPMLLRRMLGRISPRTRPA